MFSVIALIIGGAAVLGFYGYMFSHLYSEHRKLKRGEKHLAEHLSRIDPPRQKFQSARSSPGGKSSGSFRTRATHFGVALAGFAAMFAELEILNRLIGASK
jgi:hypothetical protein